MTANLTDIDQLILNVWTPSARPYVEEASVCYRSGSNRAAIISIWIAVCVDIVEKIKFLANAGDSEAIGIQTRLSAIIRSKNIQQMLEFERGLLESAENKFEFITHVEARQLERLKEDRGACAHPTLSEDGRQFVPTPELARLHIVQACEALLVHPPTQGKAILDTLIMLVQEPSFPDDPDQAYTVLSSSGYLAQAKDSAVRNFCVMLLKRVYKSEDGLSISFGNRMVAALVAISRINAPIFLAAIRDTLNNLLIDAEDRYIRRVFILARMYPAVWNDLKPAIQIRMTNVVGGMPSNDVVKFDVPAVADKNMAIGDALRKLLHEMGEEDRNEVLKTKPANSIKQFAIGQFTESGSFNSAYTNGTELLLPYAKFFDQSDLTNVLTGALKNEGWRGINQILHAGGMDQVFASLYDETKSIYGAKEAWKSFWSDLPVHNKQYPELRSRLENDNVIEVLVEEKTVDDDLPF